MIGDSETFTFGQADEGDEERPPERDVIHMTNDMYKKTFCADPLSFGSCTPTDKPWFIAFVAFKRSDEQWWQSAYVTNTMKVLAE